MAGSNLDLSSLDADNLSDEDIQQLVALGIIPDQQKDLDSQMATAQAIRDKGAPQGQYSRGGVYTAASPLEHIAYAAQGIKAGHDLNKLRGEQQKLLAQQIRGRSKYFNKFRDTPEHRAAAPFMQGVGVDSTLVDTPEF